MPGNGHTFSSASMLMWGIWVNMVRSWAGFEVCRFCGYLIVPQASNSSSSILFLDWGLVCQRVFSMSAGLSFVQHFKEVRSPAVFHCYLLQEVGGTENTSALLFWYSLDQATLYPWILCLCLIILNINLY